MSGKIGLANSLAQLSPETTSARLLEKPTFDVTLYKPHQQDDQTTHKRDEVYVIAEGSGDLTSEGVAYKFGRGDVFFVPAGAVHRFETFSDDFCTWVIFFGPRPSQQS